jgi:hypothetical protein
MVGKVRLNAKMEVSNNEHPGAVLDDERGTIAHKLEVHNSLRTPFWGW